MNAIAPSTESGSLSSGGNSECKTSSISQSAISSASLEIWLRLLPGKTLADWDGWARTGLKGPPPAVLLGGIVGLAPGRHAYFTTRIEPGRHVLICYVPDSRDGKSHKSHGMVREIEVGGV